MTDNTTPTPSTSLRTRAIAVLIISIVLVNAISWGLLLWKIPYTDATVFLHYNVFYGIDLVGTWKSLFWLPGSGLAFALINILLLRLSKVVDTFIAHIVLIITLLFQIMLAVASLLVVLLNN